MDGSNAPQPAVRTADSLLVRWYPALLLGLWVFVPEVRRLVDWEAGFNSLPVINLIPIAALLPLAVAILRGRRRPIGYAFKVAAWLWVAAFAYALLVGWLSGRLFGAAYECATFVCPLLVGVWLAAMPPGLARRTCGRFANAGLVLVIFVSAYGIYQYVSPPPWDVYWMVNSGLASIGNPVPFEVRVFSCLNSPLTCADFIALAMLLILYRLRTKTLWLIAPLMVCIAALILTLVRTAWLEVAVGVGVFVWFSPRRGVVLAASAVALVLSLFVITNLTLLTGNPQVANQVQDRLDTFSSLPDDGSADSREHGSATTLHQALEEPLGQGLGFAAGAKLAGGNTVTAAATYGADNGYLERFLEMGAFGLALYLGAILTALVFSINGLRRLVAARDDRTASLVATLIAIQIALIGADLSADHHVSLTGVFFWIVVGLSSALGAEGAPQRVLRGFGGNPEINRAAGAL